MKDYTLRALRMLTPGPAVRVSLGLSSLVVSLLLAADLMFGLLPDPGEQLRQVRARIAENMAFQTVAALETGNQRALNRLFQEVLAREKGILSVAVRRGDGDVLAQAGNHAANWTPRASNRSTPDQVQVPLELKGAQWGGVEISFASQSPAGFWGWLSQPSVSIVLLLGVGSFAGFTLYLRRVLTHLDPSAVIPDRVRSAFDAFSSGVMIVDPACRVMLANAALRSWMGGAPDADLHGRAVDTLEWFKRALPLDRESHPWLRAMASRLAVEGESVDFQLAGGEALRVLVNASPITDSSRKVRGCLVTFENVTPLHDLNAQLVKSMAALEASKREVEKKNEELNALATRDPLTGCLNRRALFEKFETLYLEARENGHALSCIMTDIDHFKSFNDRHGHAVGDQVLQSVSRRLAGALREMDLLCRYGGEEFCIVLPGTTLEQACAVADRLRADVERRAGASIRSTNGLQVSSSFGVAAFMPDISDPAQLIDRADQALYAAKKAGRNCVKTYQPQAAAA